MKKFVLKFLVLFIAVISISFFSLTGFQKHQMEKELMPAPPMYEMPSNPYFEGYMPSPPQRIPEPPKDPTAAIPLAVIIGVSLIFILILLKYINNNFVIPLTIIEENLRKIKDGKLDVKFDVKSENKSVLETFETMNQMVASLKQMEKLQNNFIQTLTHDLRTPMIAQERALAILQDEFSNNELLNGMRQNTGAYLEMINLVMEACTDRKIKIEKMKFDFSNLVETILKALAPVADEKNIKLEKDMPKNFMVYADYISMNRIITNLVSNAVENIGKEKTVSVYAYNLGKNSIIEIEDNGKGINEEDLATIFDKYSSKNITGKKVVSGLGLYIVHELVEKNGGTITVQSEPDKGTKFTISLPKEEENEKV